jgi:pyruvate formate lyase activating enzyme
MSRRDEVALEAVEMREFGRDWYDITSWKMTSDGECAKCGEVCAGLFEARPGVWGSRRLPVRALTA